MIPNDDLDTLTDAIRARHDGRPPILQGDSPGPETFILFLGSECARAARVPSIDSLADRASELILGGGEAGAQSSPPGGDSDAKDVIKSLYKMLDRMSRGMAYTMLKSLYMNVPVPLFYQDLAQLVKAGYFNRILTTNFDTLLEQALDAAGMQAGFDYCVTSLGIKSDEDEQERSAARKGDAEQSEEDGCESREPVNIIKLHGDMAQQQTNLRPDRIEKALRSQRRFVRNELKGDIIMVGYRFESQPVNEWLASTSTTRDQLWWVGAEPPGKGIGSWAPQISLVGGDVGRPETFFSQLVLRLLRQPVLESLNKSFKDYATGSGLEIKEEAPVEAPAQGAQETYGEDDPSIVELRDKIRRNQATLFGFELTAPTSERPLGVQAQINYQKRHIAKFEDKLRNHPACRRRIVELIDLITTHAEQASDEIRPDTINYLHWNAEGLRYEYEQGDPNQHVIAAAICATVLLADRLRVELGEEAMPSDLLRELASYVPSLTARGVIQ